MLILIVIFLTIKAFIDISYFVKETIKSKLQILKK